MCCTCGGGITQEAEILPPECCPGTTESTTFSTELDNYCCDGFDYCENGYENDCFTGDPCPNYDPNCFEGMEADLNGNCCNNRIIGGPIRNEHGQCGNYDYC